MLNKKGSEFIVGVADENSCFFFRLRAFFLFQQIYATFNNVCDSTLFSPHTLNEIELFK